MIYLDYLTGVAALELKRKFIGIEINEEYFKIALE